MGSAASRRTTSTPRTKRKTSRSPKKRPSAKELAKRDQLAVAYLPLVRHVVARIARHLPAHVDTDELFQVGSIGLVNASRAFDESRGVSFKTYAFALIRGAVLDELRRLDVVPRSTREKIRALETHANRLSHELGRPPAPSEIAEAMDITRRQVEDLQRAARSVAVLSLDDGSSSPDALLVRDILPCPRSIDPGANAARDRPARDHHVLPRGSPPARDRRDPRRDRVARLPDPQPGPRPPAGAPARGRLGETPGVNPAGGFPKMEGLP